MHKGCLITSLFGILTLYGCYRSDIADPPGWTCTSFGRADCVPQNNQWDGLKIGMTRAEALKAACTMTNRGIISTDEQWERQSTKIAPFVDSPVETVNGTCRAKAFYTKTDSRIWAVQARHLHCMLFLERRAVFVEFDDKNKLTSISAYCPFPDF
jgi:hypothetical protein